MNTRTFLLIVTVLATFTVVVCIRWIDYPLAFLINQITAHHRIYVTKMKIPDILLPGCILLVTSAWAIYYYCTVTNRFFSIVPLAKTIGIILPIVYIVKEVTQLFFGRVYPRAILVNPLLQQFRFFHENYVRGGFPSGHMMIATALLLVLRKHSPLLRPAWLSLGIVLRATLVVTDYHFLGDVIAGAYFGFIIEHVVDLRFNVAFPSNRRGSYS